MLFHFTLAQYYAHFTNPVLNVSIIITAFIMSAVVRRLTKGQPDRDGFCELFAVIGGILYALALIFTVLLDIFIFAMLIISQPLAQLFGLLFVSVWELV